MDHAIFDEQPHIFNVIKKRRNNTMVKQYILLNPWVLDKRTYGVRMTPLMYIISMKKPTLALWVIERRGQHDLNTQDNEGLAAMHYACQYGLLAVVQALVAAGADPAILGEGPCIPSDDDMAQALVGDGGDPRAQSADGVTPLMYASANGHPDIVTYLLQLPAVKAGIDAMSLDNETALSLASLEGHTSTVQLLLGAGADPTIPAGDKSPLNLATRRGHVATAALLRRALAKRGPRLTMVMVLGLVMGAYLLRWARGRR